jgi:hypothetical protein
MGLYLGEKPLTPCSLLEETSKNQFECGLILKEKDPLKHEALKNIIFAGQGCSHIYGPSPISLMRELVNRGLNPKSDQWESAKANTINEYQKMAEDSSEAQSILLALVEFNQYCIDQENHQ